MSDRTEQLWRADERGSLLRCEVRLGCGRPDFRPVCDVMGLGAPLIEPRFRWARASGSVPEEAACQR